MCFAASDMNLSVTPGPSLHGLPEGKQKEHTKQINPLKSSGYYMYHLL
jgi:hypothetical protein